MEVLSLFTIADFLAYLFPGILSLSGLYLLLLLTPLQYYLKLPEEIGGWLAFLILSYLTGVLIGTVTDALVRERPKTLRRKQNKGNIQIHDDKLKTAVMEAFNDIFLSQKGKNIKKPSKLIAPLEWNEYHYYVCRSLVADALPRAAASGLREGAYRQLRMNLIGSIVIWGLAGILWGLMLLSQAGTIYTVNEMSIVIPKEWSISLIIVSVLMPLFLVSNLLTMMDKHERREVREILTTFLAGYRTGVFDRREK
jgi:hypothetical protein